MSNITKVTKGISLDKDLVAVSDELRINRSEAAQSGLLEAVLCAIEYVHPDKQEEYKKRLVHLTQEV